MKREITLTATLRVFNFLEETRSESDSPLPRVQYANPKTRNNSRRGRPPDTKTTAIPLSNTLLYNEVAAKATAWGPTELDQVEDICMSSFKTQRQKISGNAGTLP